MTFKVVQGLFIPFIGTALGSACVFVMKNEMKESVQKALLGFAGGVMAAASVWSLLIPAMDMSQDMGKMAFVPAAVGFLAGIAFLLFMDKVIPHMHLDRQCEGPRCRLDKNTLLLFAVALHNLPEGMAVGAVYAAAIAAGSDSPLAAALALSVGIAIQNFPEGAIISMPLRSRGVGKTKAFVLGALSGIVEPIGAFLTIAASSMILPILPYTLSFAAGAMIYVVVEELIPEMSVGKHSNIGTVMFSLGFTVMMVLDVALG